MPVLVIRAQDSDELGGASAFPELPVKLGRQAQEQTIGLQWAHNVPGEWEHWAGTEAKSSLLPLCHLAHRAHNPYAQSK